MSSTNSWLAKLKISEIHRLAVLLGTPCSGTKTSRISGIEHALSFSPNAAIRPSQTTVEAILRRDEDTRPTPERVSLVSIDMGIRNLAFACFSAEMRDGGSGRKSLTQYKDIKLEAWRKIDVSKPMGKPVDDRCQQALYRAEWRDPTKDLDNPPSHCEEEYTVPASESEVRPPTSELFEPSVYADHAYKIITSIVNEHKPTHVLIERQRFRSGGSSAVLEWTIRVGVFEGMLYAVLRTLAGERMEFEATPVVEGMLPARINRLWFEGGHTTNGLVCTIAEKGTNSSAKVKGKDMKKAKIRIVSRLLADTRTPIGEDEAELAPLRFKLGEEVLNLVEYFEKEVSRPRNSRRRDAGESAGTVSGTKVSKLDDLADCLLQGLTWLEWQNNRMRTRVLGQDAFQLSDTQSDVKKKKQRIPK